MCQDIKVTDEACKFNMIRMRLTQLNSKYKGSCFLP